MGGALLVLAALLSGAFAIDDNGHCHVCFEHCKTSPGIVCDCEGNTTCQASACFVKLEMFPDEHTTIVQKGCASEVPGGIEGCQYAGQNDSLHCYCTGNNCNTRHQLNNYTSNRLPTVECCECSETHNADKKPCPDKGCLRKCKGNYCLVDFDGVEQGCGIGYPRLHSFLRSSKFVQGQTTCARCCSIDVEKATEKDTCRYQATMDTIVHGCTCTKPTGFCNELNKTRDRQLKEVIERRLDANNFCYSLHHKSKQFIGQEVFAKSDTCEGQYCFVSLTSSELVVESDQKTGDFIGLSRPKFEILAGCLKVDDDRKVSVGCSSEWIENISQPLSRHCICDSHLCNFHHLLVGGDDPRQEPSQKTNDVSGQFTFSLLVTFLFPLFFSIVGCSQ